MFDENMTVTVDSNELFNAIVQLETARDLKAECEAQEKKAKMVIKLYTERLSINLTESGEKVHIKCKSKTLEIMRVIRTVFDTRRFEILHPDLWSQFTSPSDSLRYKVL